MAEERDTPATDNSTSSYLWYTAIWYIVQYLVITALHFISHRQFNRSVLQKATSDTLLLTLALLCLQWAERLLSYAVWRLPYVLVHLVMDLIPTILWLCGAQLLLLVCLGLAQKLYLNLSHTKISLSSVETQLDVISLTSISKSMRRLEDTVHRHINKLFPRLAKKHAEQAKDSAALFILFTSAFLLLELSSTALAFLDSAWPLLKTCYHRISAGRMQEVKGALRQLSHQVLIIIMAASSIQYKAVLATAAEGRQLLKQALSGKRDKHRKSINADNGTSAGASDADLSHAGNHEDKQHDD